METVEQAHARLTAYAESIVHLFGPPPRVTKPFKMPPLTLVTEPKPDVGGSYFSSQNRIELYGFECFKEVHLVHELCHAWIDQFDVQKYAHGQRFQERLAVVYHRLGWGAPPEWTRRGKDTPPEHSTELVLDPAKLVAQEDEERRKWEQELREREERDRKRAEEDAEWGKRWRESVFVPDTKVHPSDIKRPVPDAIICQFAEAIVHQETKDLPSWARSMSRESTYRKVEQVRMELREVYKQTDDWEKTKEVVKKRKR